MPQLTISLFGPLRVALDEPLVSGFASKKAQALLAYLVVEAARPHTRQELQGLLWPNYPDSSASANLRSVLANIRRVIHDQQASPPFLLVTRETIQFNVNSNHHRDLSDLQTLPSARSLDPATAERLARAVDLAQTPLLAGFDLSDSPAFEEWLLLQREFLNRQLMTALRCLAEYHEAQGAFDQAIHFAQRRVLLDSWQEEAHCHLMLLFAHSGQRSRALAQFETCKRVLATDLRLEPSAQTVALAEQIRRGEIAAERTPALAAPVAARLRRPMTPLVGREPEIAELTGLLARPLPRLITLAGPGGVGKTHLALEVAAGQSGLFGDGAVLVELAPLSSADDLVAAIAKPFGFTFRQDTPPEDQLLDFLRDKELLLVMDNFEHLLPGVAFIQRALDAAPRLKILATSRIRLQARDEQLVVLEGLAYPEDASSATAEQTINEATHQAIALFMQSARRLRPEFGRAAAARDLVEIGRICRLVHGLPLAILLASAWIEMLTPAEIAAEIEHGFQFLEVDDHGLPKRHHSLQGVFEHSWQLLTAEEQTMFMRFAVFCGGCTRAAAQAVTAADLAHLRALTSKFFLSVVPAAQGGATVRYEVHELLRQFAIGKLSRLPNDEQTVRQRHSSYYLAFLSQRGEELKGSRQYDAYNEIEAEVENIRAAWQWAVEQQQLQVLRQALDGLGMSFEWRGRYQDGEAICHAAVEQLAQIELRGGQRLLAALLTWQARFNRGLGQTELARQLTRRSLELLNNPDLEDQDVAAEKAAALFELAMQSTNHLDTNQRLRQALALFYSVGDRWGAAKCLHQLGGNLSLSPGEDVQGQEFMQESLTLYQSLGDRRNTAIVLDTMGFYACLRGSHEEGEVLLRESLAINREVSNAPGIEDTLRSLAYGLLFSGKFSEGLALAQERLQSCRNFGHRPLLASAHSLLAALFTHLGRYDEALEHAQQSLQLTKSIHSPERVSYSLWLLGDVMLAKRAFGEAERILQESVSIHRETAYQGRLQDVLTSLGLAAYGLDQTELLRYCLHEALAASIKYHFWYTAIQSIPLAALLALTQGQVEWAVEIYALALSVPHIANALWWEEVAGRHVQNAARALPAPVVALAQARGSARDLWQTAEELLAMYHL